MPVDFAGLSPVLTLGSGDVTGGAWVEEAKAALARDGAVLLRGPINDPNAAEDALSLIDGELLDNAFWSTPRSSVGRKTFTATEYPSPRQINLHSEMSYMRAWPRLIAFHALEVADEGGETTVCDLTALSTALGGIVDTFAERGVLYRRSFHQKLDLPWQTAFQTDDAAKVEAIATGMDMQLSWLDGGVLQTSHTAQGAIRDEAGRLVWFNQSNLFHPSTLGPSVRRGLVSVFGEDRLPRDARFADGEPIPDEMIAEVNAAFDRITARMCWRPGDILVLDNMRFAHGRLPFRGSRRLHVALARRHEAPVRTSLFESEAAAA